MYAVPQRFVKPIFIPMLPLHCKEPVHAYIQVKSSLLHHKTTATYITGASYIFNQTKPDKIVNMVNVS